MKSIYVFRREDGSVWADYKVPHTATILEERSWNTTDYGIYFPSRVKALAQRQIKDVVEQELPANLSLWQRLKWVISGR